MFGKVSLLHVTALCQAVLLVEIFTDYVAVVNEAKIIYIEPLASKKISKNFGGHLELLTSISVK